MDFYFRRPSVANPFSGSLMVANLFPFSFGPVSSSTLSGEVTFSRSKWGYGCEWVPSEGEGS